MIRSQLALLLILIMEIRFPHESQRQQALFRSQHTADKGSIYLYCNNISQDAKSIVSIHAHIFNVYSAKTQGREGANRGC